MYTSVCLGLFRQRGSFSNISASFSILLYWRARACGQLPRWAIHRSHACIEVIHFSLQSNPWVRFGSLGRRRSKVAPLSLGRRHSKVARRSSACNAWKSVKKCSGSMWSIGVIWCHMVIYGVIMCHIASLVVWYYVTLCDLLWPHVVLSLLDLVPYEKKHPGSPC